MNKLLFKGTSNIEFFLSLILRVAALIAMGYFLFIYEENPPVLITFAVVSFLFFIYIGNDEQFVYSDKFVQNNTSIVNAIFKSKGKVYKIEDIKLASLPIPIVEKPNAITIGIIVLLIAILPMRNRVRNDKSSFFLEMKGGKLIKIDSSLDESTIIEIVEKINSLK